MESLGVIAQLGAASFSMLLFVGVIMNRIWLHRLVDNTRVLEAGVGGLRNVDGTWIKGNPLGEHRHLRAGDCTFKVTLPRVVRLASCSKNNDKNSVQETFMEHIDCVM